MDRAGIAVSITSLSTPGVWFGDIESAKHLARQCNEFAADMERDHPGRFGFFATVPMPDIDATLAEICYAFDTLHADGIGLMSNYGRIWPGDRRFAAVFDELNNRSAVVYVHPITPDACRDMIPGVGQSTLEYLFDTTRAIASLVYNGALLRWPNIRFVFPHAGGALPALAERMTRMADRDRRIQPKPEVGSLQEVRSLYFDVATSTNPVTMAGLLQLVPVGHVMFGSDYPYFPSISYTLDRLRRIGIDGSDLAAVEHGTALRLFPRHGDSVTEFALQTVDQRARGNQRDCL